MSQRGLHLVADGQVEAGMALLDEALAAVAAGEVRDLVAVGAMYCKMLHACELTCDVRRAEDWLALADRFVEQTNRIPISAICRTHYGAVLTAAGRWIDAERELATALELYDRSYRALRGSAVVRLAFRPPAVDVGDPKVFERIVRGVFRQRRKTLHNALKPVADSLGRSAADLIERAGVDGSRRPEMLTLAEMAALSRAVL